MADSDFGVSRSIVRSRHSLLGSNRSLVEENHQNQWTMIANHDNDDPPLDLSKPTMITTTSTATTESGDRREEDDGAYSGDDRVLLSQDQHPVESMDCFHNFSVDDISKDDCTAVSSLSFEDNTIASQSEYMSQSMNISFNDTGSVAHLRGWLNDFSKQQQTHFQKNNLAKSGSNDTSHEKTMTTTRPSIPKPRVPAHDVNGLPTRKTMSDCGPGNLSTLATTTLVKRLVDSKPMAPRPIGSSGAGCHHPYSTPIRIKPKIDSNEVQATNEGYASVAKLSAWLADDPTRTKKVKQIRRGANILAKSRTFDKGLANVIIEQNNIQQGNVGSRKKWLEGIHASSSTAFAASAVDASENSAYDDETSVATGLDWPGRSVVDKDCSSVVNVSSKKEWLANAFKSKTDIGTAQDDQDDITARAKQLWRQRTNSPAPKKTMDHRSSLATPGLKSSRTGGVMTTPGSHRPPVCSSKAMMTITPGYKTPGQSATGRKASNQASSSSSVTETSSVQQQHHHPADLVEQQAPQERRAEIIEPNLDFKAARGFLVQRTKRNSTSSQGTAASSSSSSDAAAAVVTNSTLAVATNSTTTTSSSNLSKNSKSRDFPNDEITLQSSNETDISTLSGMKDRVTCAPTSMVNLARNPVDVIHQAPGNPTFTTEEVKAEEDATLKSITQSVSDIPLEEVASDGNTRVDLTTTCCERRIGHDESVAREKGIVESQTGFHAARSFLIMRTNSVSSKIGSDDASFRSVSQNARVTAPPPADSAHRGAHAKDSSSQKPPKMPPSSSAFGVYRHAAGIQMTPPSPVRVVNGSEQVTVGFQATSVQKPSISRSKQGHLQLDLEEKAKVPQATHLKAADSSQNSAGQKDAVVVQADEPAQTSDAETPQNIEVPSVDFHSARSLLVKRAKQNGAPVEVLTKVSRRKAKFEQWTKDMQSKQAKTGLLKPTWSQEETIPSQYTKRFVDNVAPRKSFEELP